MCIDLQEVCIEMTRRVSSCAGPEPSTALEEPTYSRPQLLYFFSNPRLKSSDQSFAYQLPENPVVNPARDAQQSSGNYQAPSPNPLSLTLPLARRQYLRVATQLSPSTRSTHPPSQGAEGYAESRGWTHALSASQMTPGVGKTAPAVSNIASRVPKRRFGRPWVGLAFVLTCYENVATTNSSTVPIL